MSKKLEEIKNMVFYSHVNPIPLARVISDMVTDVVSNIKVSGAKKITVPTDSDVTEDYSAVALSQFGDTMEDSVTLALNEEVTGVSISGNTVTVSKTATNDYFVIKATCGSITYLYRVNLVTGK